MLWLDSPDWPGDCPARHADGGEALVIGCGLGDDAEELARRGYAVTAFDISPTAIARCRERFPQSPVHYRVADVPRLPGEWQGRFGLAVEINTIQSLPGPTARPQPPRSREPSRPAGCCSSAVWLAARTRRMACNGPGR